VSKHRVPIALLALLIRAASAEAELPAAVQDITLGAARDFGYVMGDPIRNEIEIKVAKPFRLETDFLPQPGSAINDWLEVRALHWGQEDAGQYTVYRVTLTYQVFKGVRETEIPSVPGLPLAFRGAEGSFQVESPAWPFTLMPLISPKTADEQVTLRGALPPPTYATERPATALSGLLFGVAALLVYAVRRLGLPPFRAFAASPFARAVRTLKKLRRQPPSHETYRQALMVVHGALNETAGYTVLAGRLERFLAEHPEFEGLRGPFEAFFSASGRLFFASLEPDIPTGPTLAGLEELCRRSRAMERGR
jgi:mxaA protein